MTSENRNSSPRVFLVNQTQVILRSVALNLARTCHRIIYFAPKDKKSIAHKKDMTETTHGYMKNEYLHMLVTHSMIECLRL